MPTSKPMHIRVEPELLDDVDAYAECVRVGRAEAMRQLVKAALTSVHTSDNAPSEAAKLIRTMSNAWDDDAGARV